MIQRLYSDMSGEHERALKDLNIVAEYSQLVVPQNSAVLERMVQYVLEGTRTALVRAGLPPAFWKYACTHYGVAEHVLPRRKSVAADDGRSSPWEKTHGVSFKGKRIPI